MCHISVLDLSDGYKFLWFPCRLSRLSCGNSLTYISMVTGWLPPANIIATAWKVSILLRHPIAVLPEYCGQMYHLKEKIRDSPSFSQTPLPASFKDPVHFSKLPLRVTRSRVKLHLFSEPAISTPSWLCLYCVPHVLISRPKVWS